MKSLKKNKKASLKSRFGKFAISKKGMDDVKGGGWVCWNSSGDTFNMPSKEVALFYFVEGAFDGCSG